MILQKLKKRRAMLITLLRATNGHKEQAKIKLEIADLEEKMLIAEATENYPQIRIENIAGKVGFNVYVSCKGKTIAFYVNDLDKKQNQRYVITLISDALAIIYEKNNKRIY